jgi:hypothetical protein
VADAGLCPPHCHPRGAVLSRLLSLSLLV